MRLDEALIISLLAPIKNSAPFAGNASYAAGVAAVEHALRSALPVPYVAAVIAWGEAPEWATAWVQIAPEQVWDTETLGKWDSELIKVSASILASTQAVWLEKVDGLTTLRGRFGWDFRNVGRIAPAPLYGRQGGNWYESLQHSPAFLADYTAKMALESCAVADVNCRLYRRANNMAYPRSACKSCGWHIGLGRLNCPRGFVETKGVIR